MSHDIPPDVPDRYTIRLPFLGCFRSPLPANVWILAAICGATVLYGYSAMMRGDFF